MKTELHALRVSVAFALSLLIAGPASAQEETPAVEPPDEELVADSAAMTTEVSEDGTNLTVEVKGGRPKVKPLFSADVRQVSRVSPDKVETTVAVAVMVVQGKPKKAVLELVGEGEVQSVSGGVENWSVREEGEKRFLEVGLSGDEGAYQFEITAVQDELGLPQRLSLLCLELGEAVGFSSEVRIEFDPTVVVRPAEIDGYRVVVSENRGELSLVRTTAVGRIRLQCERSDGRRNDAELIGAKLVGTVHQERGFVEFELTGTADVLEDEAVLTILSGGAALEELPAVDGYRVELSRSVSSAYQLVFPEPGRYPVSLKFTTRLAASKEWHTFDFLLGSGAVVPVELSGIAGESEFSPTGSVVPVADGGTWRGFVPVNGRCHVAWKAKRKTGEGKLFFDTEGIANIGVGAGLIRQTTEIGYRILQGKLDGLTLEVDGPGEVLAVEGENVLSWVVTEAEGGGRTLQVTLSQPVESTASLRVRSQLPVDDFPVRAEPMRLTPVGAVRHSGFVRVYNLGATRLEVVDAAGLTQLAPDQFPAGQLPAGDRQNFVYRFPSAEHSFEIVANRVEPEVLVSQLVVYRLSDTDHTIEANVELDIREAPLRDWSFTLPADYSVVTVSGAAVADYVPGTEVVDDARTLKVIFNGEVSGRQLVRLQLEKNEAPAVGSWVLPRLRYPEAKSVRGQIGVASMPGLRITPGEVSSLTEIPLSRFPENRPGLQQAFRLRDREWSATMVIERLPQSVQAELFHLYSLKDGTAYASALVNYFITGAPVDQWTLTVPESAENVSVDGKDVRTWRRDGETLSVSLHQPVIGPYTLLVTYEEQVGTQGGTIMPGRVAPNEVRGERGFIQVVSPVQVDAAVATASEGLLKLDPMELPAEFRLLNAEPVLATYQYTSRPFELSMDIEWFDPGEMVPQVIEFAEGSTQVSKDGEVRTEVTYLVQSRGGHVLRLELPTGARLWEVMADGKRVNARVDGTATLIPLPASAQDKDLIEVKLRLAKGADDESSVVATLPVVAAPVLKTKWTLAGEAGRILVPLTDSLPIDQPVLKETGFEWIGARALGGLVALAFCVAIALWLHRLGGGSGWQVRVALLFLAVALAIALVLAASASTHVRDNLSALEFSVPVLAAGDQLTLVVGNYEKWRAELSVLGVIFAVAGPLALLVAIRMKQHRVALCTAGALLLSVGLLMQRGGALWFFLLVAVVVLYLLVAWFVRTTRDFARARRLRREEAAQAAAADLRSASDEDSNGNGPEGSGPVAGPATTLLAAALLFFAAGGERVAADEPAPQQGLVVSALVEGFSSADAIRQEWTIVDGRLSARCQLKLTGEPGNSFVLLNAPAVLKQIDGDGLHVATRALPGMGKAYVVTLGPGPDGNERGARTVETTFEYEMHVGDRQTTVALPTGVAAVQSVNITLDEGGWEFDSPTAMKVVPVENPGDDKSGAQLVFAPGTSAVIHRTPRTRDASQEETRFFTEVQNLFLPSPGVVDGRHHIQVRPSQGEVSELVLTIPDGFTVGDVGGGPVGTWRFNAEARTLEIDLEPAQTGAFVVQVQTQSTLGTLPAEAVFAPVQVQGAAGEVGLAAVAFGDETQPERIDAEGMSAVNLTDFNAGLLPERQGRKPVLHRVYRYGQEGGSINLRVAPVAPEVRVATKQVLSLGDERMVISSQIAVSISRAGIFSLSFPLPAGLEVESLTGPAMSHWTELEEENGRVIVIHLNGKTLGNHQFDLALAGPTPTEGLDQWSVPRLTLREAARQTGDLVIKPTAGIRLDTLTRRNVSEVDPRELGGEGQGAHAYRLLQADWDLQVGIEKLPPRITSQLLQEITLREGQTRTNLVVSLNIEDASIRSLRVRLPGISEEEAKTVRVSGTAVGDTVPVEGETEVWEVRFKRRLIGSAQLRVEFERTGDREESGESVQLAVIEESSKTTSYLAVRAGARLELTTGPLPRGVLEVDWTSVPQALREAGDRSSPALSFRAVSPEGALDLSVRRHAVAEALKLRVAAGNFLSILSPLGEMLTMADLRVDVIQRSTLRVELPGAERLFSVFVNGESVHVVRDGDAYQFYVLPGPDEKSATVEFVYASKSGPLGDLEITTPKLNIPLENITWSVVVPDGYTLDDYKGDLDPSGDGYFRALDREEFLLACSTQNREREAQAIAAVDKFNDLINRGEQTKARTLLNSVANNYALDAATNEDVRVQLRELEKRQAWVGLATREQRMLRDNGQQAETAFVNQQLEQAAYGNEILNSGQINFKLQDVNQFLGGNTKEEQKVLERLAGRLVSHQRSAESAPPAIRVTQVQEGRYFNFTRSVQVNQGEPLRLKLSFESPRAESQGKSFLVFLLVAALASGLVLGVRQKVEG